MARKHLIIPDGHAHPEYGNERFTALGNLIMEERPDVIICLGDFADVPSLSSYDKGTRGFEGRRYRRDLEAVWDAQERLWGPLNEYNASRRRGRHKRYKPQKELTYGNHEDRISRAANSQPELDGTIGLKDLRYEAYGWHTTPFKEAVTLDGIAYSHYFASGLSGQAISGENIGGSLVKKLHMSAVQGHSHLYSHYEHTRPDHQKIFGLSAGCYAHKDFVEGWNLNTAHLWWHGVVILEGAGRWPGYYEEIRSVCQTKIMERYL